ncbi:Glycosyltransferase [Heracleum sosnowskyi]|uniref:Glycosyltransferase n=1 Tax=Heracleum sosnowskyi TaxID=360622 RepID=A0AAD8MXJ9_9APIA|nr:Glycosyltransferase [Heracleum sosnowskyi]
MRAELIFIPSPGVGHLLSTVEVAKLLVSRDDRISVSILIIRLPFDSGIDAFTENLKKDAPERVAFLDVPALDDIAMAEVKSLPRISFLDFFIEKHRTQVRDVVAAILNQSKSSKLCGFVIDMFCTSMIDVANEFNVPAYVFFTSGASFLSLMFHIQNLKDVESRDVYKYKDSDVELSVSGFQNQVPAKVLPSMMLTKDGSAVVIATVRRLQETKAILVNTAWELESHAIKSFVNDETAPLIYHVGPIINFKSGEATTISKTSEEAIMTWLDSQPPSSVVYLCFGSTGSFEVEQLREIAHGLELSGQRFLWSLRHPSQEKKQVELLKDYEDYNEVLPAGFLERTSGKGKIIGWAPQVRILSHSSVGGFVSHCGWNSILESIWCGVPIATWPMYAEQQTNAFQLVVELGIAAEIKMDYRRDSVANIQSTAVVTAEEIERGITCLMDGGSEMRRKMKVLRDTCRKATELGGSSHTSLGQFVQDVTDNIREGASD